MTGTQGLYGLMLAIFCSASIFNTKSFAESEITIEFPGYGGPLPIIEWTLNSEAFDVALDYTQGPRQQKRFELADIEIYRYADDISPLILSDGLKTTTFPEVTITQGNLSTSLCGVQIGSYAAQGEASDDQPQEFFTLAYAAICYAYKDREDPLSTLTIACWKIDDGYRGQCAQQAL